MCLRILNEIGHDFGLPRVFLFHGWGCLPFVLTPLNIRKWEKLRYMINHIVHLQSLVPGIQPNERLGVDESILYALSSARIRGCRVMKEKLLGNVKLWKLISDTFIAPGNTSIDIRLLDTTFHQVEGNCNCVNLNRDFPSELEMGAFTTGSSEAKIVLNLTMKCNFLFVNVSLILPFHEHKTARLLRIHLKYYHWMI